MKFQLAQQTFRDALGDGIWLKFLHAKAHVGSSDSEVLNRDHQVHSDLYRSAQYPIDSSATVRIYKDFKLFHRLEEKDITVELPYNKVSTLFNLARLLEQLHDIETASAVYRLILYKVQKLKRI